MVDSLSSEPLFGTDLDDLGMSSQADEEVHDVNPYEGNPNLTQLESEVLWQYAVLAQNIKEVSSIWLPHSTYMYRLGVKVYEYYEVGIDPNILACSRNASLKRST